MKTWIIPFILFWTLALSAKSLEGIVEKCYDGDTCHVRVDSKKLKIRLSGIDAPELKQTEGKFARNYLQYLIQGQKVKLVCTGKSYDRRTCEVYLGDLWVNRKMVQEGWAWDSPKYSKRVFQEEMRKAQKEKKGIWSGTPISPFGYRHGKQAKCLRDAIYMP